MKIFQKVMWCCCVAAFVTACKKDTVATTPLASLNLVNATVNAPAVKANFTSVPGNISYYNLITATTSYGANTAYGVLATNSVALAVALSTDSTKLIYNGSLNFGNGELYTLYLAGQATAPDTILRKENIPAYQDSSCGVRFINLSYNSTPIKVTLSTTPTVSEMSSLAYKAQSEFIKYDATVANNTRIFQVRDASTNAILASYTLTVPRFFACTLAWIGQTGTTGTNAPKVQRINNY
ncbi:MAG: hypothetical protein ABI581_05010 [Sediminibacterium sp.]